MCLPLHRYLYKFNTKIQKQTNNWLNKFHRIVLSCLLYLIKNIIKLPVDHKIYMYINTKTLFKTLNHYQTDFGNNLRLTFDLQNDDDS